MIATLARARGMSIAQLAGELGVHRNRLADKIAGRQPFKESEIVAAARFFGVPPGQLFQDPLELLGVSGGSSSAWTRRVLVRRHLRVAA